MQDAAAMGRVERVGQLGRDRGDLRLRQRAAEWRALDVLEHDIVRADVVDLTDFAWVSEAMVRASCANRSS
jgi:hypothetical protein